MKGSHLIKSWSSTQKSITLSSGEAELVAAVKTCTELIGISQLMRDWGKEVEGEVYVDSNAAIGTAMRRGNGELRHVRVGIPWIQEKVAEEEFKLKKILGDDNPADLLTKNVNGAKVEKYMNIISEQYKDGRAAISTELK
jgi:hypothetical protein